MSGKLEMLPGKWERFVEEEKMVYALKSLDETNAELERGRRSQTSKQIWTTCYYDVIRD